MGFGPKADLGVSVNPVTQDWRAGPNHFYSEISVSHQYVEPVGTCVMG